MTEQAFKLRQAAAPLISNEPNDIGANLPKSKAPKASEAQEHVAAFVAKQIRDASDRTLGEALIRMGKLDATALERVKKAQAKKNISLGAAAVRLGYAKREDLRHALAISHGLLTPDAAPNAVPKDLTLIKQPSSSLAERFRAIRTELLTEHEPCQTACISVVSHETNRHADFVAINLASSFAQLHRRTLLIDTDLRHTRLERAFRLQPEFGLRDVLEGIASPEEACTQSVVSNLSLMMSGRPSVHAQQLLAQPRFEATIEALKADFDHIVMLSAPHGEMADGRYAWRAAGAAFVVIRQHKDRAHQLKSIERALRSVGAQTLGSILVR